MQREVDQLRAGVKPEEVPLSGDTLAQVRELEEQVLSAEEKARQAQDIAQEAVGHAEELQQMVAEQRTEADDLRREFDLQREAMKKYEAAVEEQIQMLEKNQ